MENQPLRFSFTGTGGEYFRIWIVNVLLTILTLGIYSAWAKVRRMQYFHRNTWLNESNFDYHGTPIAILKGRLIAVAMFAGYNVMINIKPLVGLIILLLIMIVMPYLLVKSFRFRLYNTSYRGLRFGFVGSVKSAYKYFLLLPVLTMFTLYLLAPFTHQRIKAYQHKNSRFGQTPFYFYAGPEGFYKIYFYSFLILIGLITALGIAAAMLFHGSFDMNPENKKQFLMIFLLIYGLFIIGIMLIVPYFTARIQNLIWNNTSLHDHEFSSNVTAMQLFTISFTNFILILLTFGLYKPYADIRMARYRIEHIALIPSGDLESFIASEQQNDSATGSETAEMFDIDIAL